MLIQARDRMKKLIAEGKTLEQIKELKPYADLDKTYGNGFIKPEVFIGMIYGLLSK